MDYSFARMRRLENHCLVPECYTTERQWESVSEDEQQYYVRWLEEQCGELFSALN